MQCKAGIVLESTYKRTSQIKSAKSETQNSPYVNNSFKRVIQYFYYLVHGKLLIIYVAPDIAAALKN